MLEGAKARVILRGISVVMVLAVPGVNLTATAAEPGEVEELVRRGVEFRRAGHDNLALPLLARAYTLAARPRTAAQLGLAEMALGYQLDAERHLSEALESSRDLWVQKNRATLEGSLRTVRGTIGELAIRGTPIGAAVLINGTSVGKLALPSAIKLGEGRAVVDVRAAGYVTQSISIKVTGGKREELVVNLDRTPESSPATVAVAGMLEQPGAGTAEVGGEAKAGELERARQGTPVAPSEQSPDASGGHRLLRPLAWVAGGLALAALGFGVYETLHWSDQRERFDHVTRPSAADPTKAVFACGSDEPNRGSLPVCQTLYAEMNQAKTLAIIGYAVSAGLGIGSAALFIASRRASEPSQSVALTCLPMGSLAGLSCRMSF